jgi:hypothetical protein
MPTLDAHALTDELDGLEALGAVLKRASRKPAKAGSVAVTVKTMPKRLSRRMVRMPRIKAKACAV